MSPPASPKRGAPPSPAPVQAGLDRTLIVCLWSEKLVFLGLLFFLSQMW